jgi:hypothetical protein
VSDPTRVRRHYSLSAREVDILQRALTALTTHPNGMGDVDPGELTDLSDYLGVIRVDPPSAEPNNARSSTPARTAGAEEAPNA